MTKDGLSIIIMIVMIIGIIKISSNNPNYNHVFPEIKKRRKHGYIIFIVGLIGFITLLITDCK